MGDLLVAYLKRLSVDYVFGVPGGAIEPLYNALARSARTGGPRPVVARHEVEAAFMADGYSRATGRLGVCCATTGPGATNLITGVASAYENRIPMLVITAQTALTNFGRGALQESSCTAIDIVGMFRHCTRYSTLVSHIEQFECKLAAAILHAHGTHAGPAHLSVPRDLMCAPSPSPEPSFNLTSQCWTRPISHVDASVDEVLSRLQKARKVVFVIGHGCCDAIGVILDLAMHIHAEIVVTPHGKGLVSPYHPLFRGVFGFAGHDSAREALTARDVDEIIAVGVTLSEWSSNGWDDNALLHGKLIHIDADEENFTRSPMAGMHVLGSVDGIFGYLLEQIRGGDRENRWVRGGAGQTHASVREWLREEPVRRFRLEQESCYLDDAAPIKPQRLMHDLPRMLPSNTRYVVDSGNSVAWAIHYLHPFDRRMAGKRDARSCFFDGCMEFASMGWAIGAAIGAALADRTRPVVCITGDGSLLMSGQEFTVAVQERLPVIFVILNDAALGMVKHGQRLAGAEPVGFGLPEIDYSAYAGIMGGYGHSISSPQDLAELDPEEILNRPGPTLLDVHIDREETPPIATRMKVLQSLL
ncbi:MAG TPA: thiamine pyrophosphate-binding protein [Sedimenticola sp.]|nr:thiamine pyrophosphate-binding protein [Sedimenticola sp.]